MNKQLELNKLRYKEEDRLEQQKQFEREQAYWMPGGGYDRDCALIENELVQRKEKEFADAISTPIIRTLWFIAAIALLIWWFS